MHLDDRLDRLLAILGAPIKKFLFEDLCLERQKTTYYIGRCWPVVQRSGAGGDLHHHAGAVVSGVFYLQTPPGSGGLEFRKSFRSTYDHMRKAGGTPITFGKADYPAVKNRLILFSSDVLHRALPDADDMTAQRIAISFDLYSMTEIGDSRGGMPRTQYLKPID